MFTASAPHQTLTLAFTVIPVVLALLIVLHDAIPAKTRRVPRLLQNFLTLADLHETPGTRARLSVWKARVLVCVASAHVLGWVGGGVYVIAMSDGMGVGEAVVGIVTWSFTAFRIARAPPITPPYALMLLALAHTVAGLAYLLFAALNAESAGALDVLRVCGGVLFIWIAGTLPLSAQRPVDNVAEHKDPASASLSMPEDAATFWTWWTFSFVEPIFAAADKKRLDAEDVWTLSPYFTHRNVFGKYLEYRAKYPERSLLRYLLASNSLDLMLDITLELYSAIFVFAPTYALQRILAAPHARSAYAWALCTLLFHLSYAQKDLLQTWHTRRCYERTRGTLFCALHWKALRRRDVSGKMGGAEGEEGEGGADLGKIVNMMQGDAYAVAQRFWEFSALFASPVRLIIALVFLYNVLGWSAMAGVLVVLAAYVVNYPLAKYNIHITRQSWKAKDKRMNVVNELLQNIRFLKFYGWENHWACTAHAARNTELTWRVKENTVDTLLAFVWTWVPSATALAAFLAYTLIAHEPLTVSTAFTALALFGQLQGPMTALPGQVFAMLHAYVSMQRIEGFLAEEEVPVWASSLMQAENGHTPSLEWTVSLHSAAFEWHGTPKEDNTSGRFQLGPLDVEFPKGRLTLVSGPTGAGKSALLAALLGEMRCLEGEVMLEKMGGQIAYCAQNPWLEHATIRDNILFGSPYDEGRYDTVVSACALLRDLAVLEAGDLTEIGEKGITLSGGQRARIALARAFYSPAKCILLDDPLAAVDMHTAQHIVANVFQGSIAHDRTVILVTHHISLCLLAAAYLVELAHGQIVRKGSIHEFEDLGQLDEIIEAEDDVPSDPSPTPVHSPVNEADEFTLDGKGDQNGTANEVSAGDRAAKGKLIEAEARAEGRVSFRTYWTYIKAAGIFSWFLTVLLMVLIRLINIGNQLFLARWGEAYEAPNTWGLPPPDVDVKPWLMIYLWISLAGAFTVLAYIALGYYASLQASRALFRSLLDRLARAPARFFDVTPIGRILNRFTSDINTVDGALQNSARAALSGIMNFVASFLAIISVVPSFAPFAIIVAWLYIRLAPPYVRASRDLRRLESVSLSPAFAGFDELLRGLPHVRAFGAEARYQEGFYRKVDTFQTFDHVYWLVSAWLRWRYDCLGSVIVFLTTVFALPQHGIGSGSVAFVIVQSGIFAQASRDLVKVMAQLELDYNSVERIVEYLDVPQEAPPIVEKFRPPAYWPSSTGALVVEELEVRYAPDLPIILKQLSFTVRPSEKVGVVGRTGSGKSTLALTLLRMVEPSGGRIIIDGIDVTKIGLEDLRTRITIVSQDVSLFSGTIRSNLDPFSEHTDRECWDALERCHLTSLLKRGKAESTLSLDMPMSQGGSLSAGERQLVALARAVLRRTNIVVMDEATSQIDSELDDQIQKTIREELSDALVITIAHRLKTIIDYDRILVLDAGQIVEFAPPLELLKRPGGRFYEMCKRSADWRYLLSHSEGTVSRSSND